MKLLQHFSRIAAISVMAFAVAGCASAGDRRTNNTLLGAGLGAATGAVFSQGDPLYTVGGAAAGGLLGNILTPDRSHDRHYKSHSRRSYKNSRHSHAKRHGPPRHHHQSRRHRHRR